tara:strand:+ start:23 stop:457 length:435 start_codon:yes stop_codon:yes gene_type:complete
MGQLQKWLDEDWVRIGADGTILGSCGSKKEAEGKPKCLPRKKAEGMSKQERAKLVARKRRKDPNPKRKGKPINVSNKLSGGGMPKKSNKFGMDDGVQTSYEEHMQSVIEKNMKKQNRVKLKGGGFIAKGCGAVLGNRRKVTTKS